MKLNLIPNFKETSSHFGNSLLQYSELCFKKNNQQAQDCLLSDPDSAFGYTEITQNCDWKSSTKKNLASHVVPEKNCREVRSIKYGEYDETHRKNSVFNSVHYYKNRNFLLI